MMSGMAPGLRLEDISNWWSKLIFPVLMKADCSQRRTNSSIFGPYGGSYNESKNCLPIYFRDTNNRLSINFGTDPLQGINYRTSDTA
jgi:hypothetical protein